MFFFSHQKSSKTKLITLIINKIKAWLSLPSYKFHMLLGTRTIGHLKDQPHNLTFPTKVCVQEFSAYTKLQELALRRGKLGRLYCVMYRVEF